MTTPAEIVVKMFGGIRPLAQLLEINPSSVCRWNMPRAKKGADGNVPQRYHRVLLDLAKEQKKRLTLQDLCFGRESPTIRQAADAMAKAAGKVKA